MFSVYGSPAFQNSNACLNIKHLEIDDCSPFVDTGNKVAPRQTCEDANGSDAVCRWGIAHPDCPDGGFIGIAFTAPGPRHSRWENSSARAELPIRA